MELWENIRQAVQGIWTNKLRSGLTMLGIIIGIAAVIAVVAIGQGGQALLQRELEKFGTNIFYIFVDWRNNEPPTSKDFALVDVEVIKNLVPAITGLSPSQDGLAAVKGNKKSKNARIQGSNGDYPQIRNIEMLKGRYFSNADTKGERKVIVLEDKLAEELFGRQDPLGQRVTVKNLQVTVIGIARSNNSKLMSGLATAYLPFTVWQKAFGEEIIQAMEGQTSPGEDGKVAIGQAVKILERKHNTTGRYSTITMEQQMESANKITGILTMIVGGIAGISLFVGGIGVMNIMLVSVTERTREIGIRKALGARRQDILSQFLIESLVICFIGGIIGMIFGIGGAFLIAKLAKWPPLVSWTTVVVAFLFSTAVGLFFGIYPASKAAKLDPIEALRYE